MRLSVFINSLVLICLALLGCTPEPLGGELTLEVVAPGDSFASYALAEVQVSNVENIYELSHDDFKFLGGGLLKGDDMQALLGADVTPESFAVQTRAHFAQTLEPNLVVRDGVVHSQDFHSLMALTAFAGFSKIWGWYASGVGDQSAATSSPGFIVFYGDIVPSALLPVPMIQMDNAVYLAGVDVWMIFPVGNQEGVPYAMNQGVLAHEFHHRVFFQNVWSGNAFERWKSILSSTEQLSANEQRSLNLLRALDEGLADINAIGFTQNIGFMDPSFHSEHLEGITAELLAAESLRRNIESDFVDLATYDNLADDSFDHTLVEGCGVANNFTTSGDILSGQMWSPYCLGSVLARTLWEGVGRDHDVLRNAMLPAINQVLVHLGEILAEEEDFDFDVFFQLLMEALPQSIDAALFCSEIAQRFSSLATVDRIPSCAF